MSPADALVRIGVRPGLDWGHTAFPRHRAPYARQVAIFTSGKGGLGKSTVAVNVASALARRGLRVGLLDADVHGPSIPRMLQLGGERVRWNDAGKMVPAEKFGIRVMSVGLTTPEADTPLAWRSAVAVSALVQLLEDVAPTASRCWPRSRSTRGSARLATRAGRPRPPAARTWKRCSPTWPGGSGPPWKAGPPPRPVPDRTA